MQFDVAIVGVGLCFARALAGCGLRIAIIEWQSLDAIAHRRSTDARSRCPMLRAAFLQLWAVGDVSARANPALRNARIPDADREHGLTITARDGGCAPRPCASPGASRRSAG